jgi:hypothetical protein
LHGELGFHIVFDLGSLAESLNQEISVLRTFVTLVPARKNTISRAKGRLQGWTAWAAAVKVAVTIPRGVRDL